MHLGNGEQDSVANSTLESINPGTGTPGAANFNSAQSAQWTLATAGSITGFNASSFAFDTSAFANGLGGGSLNITDTGTSLVLNFTPVPEPSTWLLLAFGGMMVGAAYRRRK